MANLPRERGYTLLELMIAFAIAGTLSAIAVPSLSSWIQNSRIEAAAQAISTGVLLARSEAITRNQNIHVSSVDNNLFHICVDPGDDTSCDSALQNDYITKISVEPEVIIEGDKATEDGLVFSTRGRLLEQSRTALFTICDTRGDKYGIRFQINQVGRVLLRPIDTEAGESCQLT
ncbi:MAG: GspH/FimT family pseudopilin [Granulosicoccus sp.]|nr:GspH/FimT family pseudopilin [Granulosicoccus sp.]